LGKELNINSEMESLFAELSYDGKSIRIISEEVVIEAYLKKL